jgi:predicted transcriptional regulator
MEITIKQIAQMLGITQKAVRNRLHRRGIKPVRHSQDVTYKGLIFSRGFYQEDVLEKIK